MSDIVAYISEEGGCASDIVAYVSEEGSCERFCCIPQRGGRL